MNIEEKKNNISIDPEGFKNPRGLVAHFLFFIRAYPYKNDVIGVKLYG